MNQYDPIKNKLKGYSVQVDKEKLWANTSHAVPRKRRRRGFILFFSGLALLVAGSLLIMRPSTTLTSIAPSQKYEDDQTISQASSEQPSAKKEPNDAATKNNQSSTTISTTLPSSATHQTIQQTHSTQNFPSSVSKPIRTEPNPAQETTKQKQESAGEERKSTPSDKRVSSENATISTQDIQSALPFLLTDSDLVSPGEASTSIDDELMADMRPSNWNTPPVDHLLIQSLELIERPTGMESLALGIQPSRNHFPVGLALIQGVGFSTLQIEPLSSDVEEITATLSAQTRSLEQLYTSLHAYTPISKNIRISSGLQYSRLTTELHQTTSINEDYITDGITTVIIGEDGQVENLYGDVEVHREVYTYSTRYTYQHKLDLELMLQANVFRNTRWSSDLWLKGSYNLLYTSEGTTLDKEGELLPYSSSENPFHLKSPFGYGAGINTTYKITPSWSLLGRIGYERLVYTHGVFDDQLIYKHNIFNLGLGASLSF